jgi:diguanylate cyclase
MAERNIEPTPVNYAVWYHYAVGDKGALNEEIDLMIKRKTPPSEDVTIYLYNKYVLQTAKEEEKAVTATSNNTQAVLSEIMQIIDRFSGDTQNYNEQLDEQVSKLSTKITDPTLKEMAREIVSRATAIRESSSVLTKKLEQSRSEVSHLKTNLEKVTNEANKDFLTGTGNRKAFETKIDELATLSKEKGMDLCLLMIDVDHFKRFNDKYGHQLGDEVLRKVGRTLLDTVKGKDFVSRYGGEEFAVLLPATALSTGLIVAENIRKSISETDLVRKDTGESVGPINVSIGVSRYRPQMDTVPLFISRADSALYKSKMGGRNCVTQESFDN